MLSSREIKVGKTVIRFYNPCTNDHDKNNFCDTKVKVKMMIYSDEDLDEIERIEKEYDVNKNTNSKEVYYDITYKHKLSNKKEETLLAHPFYGSENKENMEGEIITKNTLTDKLIEYLLMDLNELKKHTGKTTPLDYKRIIMNTITLMWD